MFAVFPDAMAAELAGAKFTTPPPLVLTVDAIVEPAKIAPALPNPPALTKLPVVVDVLAVVFVLLIKPVV
jgi:hypothetical protein